VAEPTGVEKSLPSGGEPGGETHAPAAPTTTQPELRPEGKEPDYKRLYLEQTKTLEEERNELRRKLTESESRATHAPAAPADQLGAQLEEDLIRLQEQNPEAARLISAVIDNVALTRQQMAAELQRVVDRAQIPADKVKRVEEHFSRNRNRLGDLKAAQAEIDADDLRSENQRLREEINRGKPASDLARPDSDVVRTLTREVPASDAKQRRKMTGDQFEAEAARLEAAGDVIGAMKLRGAYNRGDIEIPG